MYKQPKIKISTQFPVFYSFIASNINVNIVHTIRWSYYTLIYLPFTNFFQSNNVFMKAFDK